MLNRKAWEEEYQQFKLVVNPLEDRPQSNLAVFLKYLKRKEKINIADLAVLDLGSGVGRNSTFLAGEGAKVVGLEFSRNALGLAQARAKDAGVTVDYREHDIGAPYPFPDQSFDLVLDITSSNSLNTKGRETYLSEVARVLKRGGSGQSGWFFVRALCKEGDKNAQTLLKTSPGTEPDTYVMPGLGLMERVFSRADFEELYGRYFKIVYLERTSHYATVNKRKFKRYYWVAYLQPK
jgi:SAM-dependent methyltransferase